MTHQSIEQVLDQLRGSIVVTEDGGELSLEISSPLTGDHWARCARDRGITDLDAEIARFWSLTNEVDLFGEELEGIDQAGRVGHRLPSPSAICFSMQSRSAWR
ncbi:MAG: hypothetical protein AAGB48_11255, partial [Planctomycetota bacterium]